MKRLVLFFACFLLVATGFAQGGNSGLGFNYQAVVRGLDGSVVPKQNVELRFSLMPGQQATQASWVETQNVTTDSYGTIGVTVGKGTKAGGVAATFADVNFAAVHYWLRVEINESGNYRELSYTALASVPYAEVATNAVVMPAGMIVPYGGENIPDGWLLCDGREISRSEYDNLYKAIGTVWGSGNNSTTFNLPDTRGMFLRGVSLTSGDDADKNDRVPRKEGGNSGNNVGSYQKDAIRNMTGDLAVGAGGGSLNKATGIFYAGNDVINQGMFYNYGNRAVASFDASRVVPVGSDNRPQNVYVNYIIKY